MTTAIATMRVGDHAGADYKAALRRLEIELDKHRVKLDIGAIVPEGPEALITAIDDLLQGRHRISQNLILEVCDAYDRLMDEVNRQLPNPETAN